MKNLVIIETVIGKPSLFTDSETWENHSQKVGAFLEAGGTIVATGQYDSVYEQKVTTCLWTHLLMEKKVPETEAPTTEVAEQPINEKQNQMIDEFAKVNSFLLSLKANHSSENTFKTLAGLIEVVIFIFSIVVALSVEKRK